MILGGSDALLDQLRPRRRGQVRPDGERTRQSRIRAVEGDRMTGSGGGAPAAFFNQQHSRGDIPFIPARQGDHGIRLSRCDKGERVGDRSDWAAVEMGLEAFKPADPQLPRIHERKRTMGR